MWELEIDKTLRVIDLRLAKYCHEVAERLPHHAIVERFCNSYTESALRGSLIIRSTECPFHSMILEHPKLYTILGDLHQLSKIDLFGTPFSSSNPGLVAIDRLYYNCTGIANTNTDNSLAAIEKVFQDAIDHLLDFITGRGAMPTMRRYTRRWNNPRAYSRSESEDLLKAAKACDISVEGMTYWKIIEDFHYDCFKLDEELKKMGKF